jgi:hypothetical protein
LLITAGLVRGRTLTAWKTIQDDLRKIGADVKDEPVVEDRNWITSRKPEDLGPFSDALLAALERERASEPEAEEPAPFPRAAGPRPTKGESGLRASGRRGPE